MSKKILGKDEKANDKQSSVVERQKGKSRPLGSVLLGNIDSAMAAGVGAGNLAMEGATEIEGVSVGGGAGANPLVIDGVELNRAEFELGVVPPPLEEFKRLMESLGPDSLFDDERGTVDMNEEEEDEEEEIEEEFSAVTKAFQPLVYEGGIPKVRHEMAGLDPNSSIFQSMTEMMDENKNPALWRVQICSLVTNSSKNTTALEMVEKVYNYIKEATMNDERIKYQIICMNDGIGEHGEDLPLEDLDHVIQMWIESYNTYHLIDGFAMKEAWGAIMPHIVLSEKNLNAIVDAVKWALAEDDMDGAILSPRLRRVRFRGGAQEMITGYNTENLDSEFSVVSVR
jgi:hypothetical protein